MTTRQSVESNRVETSRATKERQPGRMHECMKKNVGTRSFGRRAGAARSSRARVRATTRTTRCVRAIAFASGVACAARRDTARRQNDVEDDDAVRHLMFHERNAPTREVSASAAD